MYIDHTIKWKCSPGSQEYSATKEKND